MRRILTVAAFTLVSAAGIGPGGTEIGAGLTSQDRQGTARGAPAGPRVLLFYDLEGASGTINEGTMNKQKPDSFAIGRESLTGDVAEVVRGLFDGGATAVDLYNTHGDGDPDLVPAARLDPRSNTLATAGYQHLPYDPEHELVVRGKYDAVVLVGMHDKPLSGGFSPHTLGAGISAVIDGEARTESELLAYALGTVDIPIAFVSGDDRLQRSLSTSLPWITYVIVKEATTEGAVSRPTEKVQKDLRAGANDAVRHLRRMRALHMRIPSRAGMIASYPLKFPPGIGQLPGMELHGDTATFSAIDYRTAFRGFFGLLRTANSDKNVLAVLNGDTASRRMLSAARDTVWARYKAFEAGKWKPTP